MAGKKTLISIGALAAVFFAGVALLKSPLFDADVEENRIVQPNRADSPPASEDGQRTVQADADSRSTPATESTTEVSQLTPPSIMGHVRQRGSASSDVAGAVRDYTAAIEIHSSR